MKKFLIRFTAVLLAFQGVVAAQLLTLNVAQASGAPEVVINEVMWMGSSLGTADQWIELHNTTNVGIDISGWTLSSTGLPVFPVSSVVPAGGYFLVADSDTTSSVLNVEPDWVTTSISLSSSCSQIDLMMPDMTVVDSMGCSGVSYLAGEDTAVKRAMERNLVIEDGMSSASWHSSVGFANLDGSVNGTDFATPSFINDITGPVGGVVNEGTPGGDVDWIDNANLLPINWSGFTDTESGISPDIMVGIGSTQIAADVMAFTQRSGAGQLTIDISGVGLAEDTQYYTLIKAINGAGIVGDIVSSDGFQVNSTPPEPVTNVVAEDVTPDNGGSIEVSWDPSVSVDEISYELNYRQVGELSWTIASTVETTSQIVSSLVNGVGYEFMVRSKDFSNQFSVESSIATAVPTDQLNPILDATKLSVAQNTPGTPDNIRGTAGAVNEAGTVNIFDRDPSDPTKVLLGSVVANGDGSFDAVVVGDNAYAVIYAQTVDLSGNSSQVVTASNDIAGPNAPSLEKLVAECKSETCRVELNWQDNGPDTASFQLEYTLDGVSHQTFAISGHGLVLDLPTCPAASFKVIAVDQYGNKSLSSNSLKLQLMAGVKTTVVRSGDGQLTGTEAMSGSREVVISGVKDGPLSSLIPGASAANGEPGQANGNGEGNGDAVQEARDQDWARIVIVVLLLLAIAGGFYSLSRSFKDTPRVAPVAPIPASTKPKRKTASKRKTSSSRRRRRS